MIFSGRNIERVLVVGLGYRTGLAACNFLAGRGAAVWASDMKTRQELGDVVKDLDRRVHLLAGSQGPEILDTGFDLLVLSPGVPRVIPLVAAAAERGVPVISEIELAFAFCRGGVMAITGTDGKSTTTSLAGHLLEANGVRTFVGGNIGIPFISFVDRTDDRSVTVLELSSFQLETIDAFRPGVAAVLNVSPDHLDRYRDMDDYLAAKMRIVKNQGADDCLVYNADDARLASEISGVASRTLSFSMTPGKGDAFYDGREIRVARNGMSDFVLDASGMHLIGLHNVQNAMAALLMLFAIAERRNIPVDDAVIAAACNSFRGLPHRMELVGEFRGRRFINDSKATTVGAVEKAMKSVTGSAVLILGGRTKGDDYSRLAASLRGRLRKLILIGESSGEFSRIFAEFGPVTAASLEEAVERAMKESGEGDTVLLSPACASFDMFRSYEERGDRFRSACRLLMEGGA